MDDLADDIGKGVLRAIGYVLVNVLFNFVFYYIGWPICKIITLGKYPAPVNYDYLHTYNRQGLWCSFIGFLAVLFPTLYFLGLFA